MVSEKVASLSEHKRQKAIAQVRKVFAEAGHPVDHLTDEQLMTDVDKAQVDLVKTAVIFDRVKAAWQEIADVIWAATDKTNKKDTK